ncbi:MAG: ATP-binding cassette domain-containing protein, partial [Mycoplasmatales bacterium]
MFKVNDYKFKNNKEILLQVDKLTLAKTGLISICGEIGCGKSTLLKSFINFVKYEGTILYNDIDIKKINLNNKISYIPQNLEYYFLTNTLREEVILTTGMEIDFYKDLANKFNISHLFDSNIDSISGGEQIRCALFLNEICGVECLILDETLSMNDHKNL